ncbi:hypothetical protein [Deinococcus sp. QL22]|uniref:hypothetical protein n=1 Tax=Deinococcus sp. QL22 TaxID=2939437 RepID=UPI00201765B5|nr:hypothetical protein [Deinococcus sp. QL22]UQN09397.1 hypothetical protein M1R55_22840 [Deinococcus sp. QL22]
MTLRPPPAKKGASAPSMLDKNREVEEQQASQDALTLPALAEAPTGKFTVSPIQLDTIDGFEEIYQKLRKQRRTLKRYQVAEALLAALAEPVVLAEVVKRLK